MSEEKKDVIEEKKDTGDANKTGTTEKKVAEKKTVMKLFKVFKFLKKEKKTDDDISEQARERRSERDDGENEKEEEDKIKIKIPFKEIALVLGIALVLSVLLIFVMDLAGWRSSLRSNITTQLLGMEKQILIDKYEFEYQVKLEDETSNLLVEERANLVIEYATLETKKEELDKREKAVVKDEESLQTEIDAFTLEKEELAQAILDFEQAKLEISDLSKIYESMEPKNASDILIVMTDEDLMLQILAGMKNSNLSLILEEMEAAKAAEIIGKLN